jgi:hypothetical protein
VVELDVLAEWLRKQAEELPVRWGTLLTGTLEQQQAMEELNAKFGLPTEFASPGTDYDYLRGESDASYP